MEYLHKAKRVWTLSPKKVLGLVLNTCTFIKLSPSEAFEGDTYILLSELLSFSA